MNNTINSTCVAACGLVTSLLTTAILVVSNNLTGFDLFTLSIFVVIPVGAILSGGLASSGYYFGSLYFHQRPTIILLIQMVIIAAFTNLLIYYLEYATLVLENGVKISNFLSFQDYLNISLTESHYKLGKKAAIDLGAVGSFGYLLAFIQFIGFMLGGACVYVYLLQKTFCEKCHKYFRKLGVKNKIFENTEEFSQYYETIFKNDFDSNEFFEMISEEKKLPVKKGCVNLTENLLGCHECKQQLIENIVQVYNGNDWKNINELERKELLPIGVSISDLFGKNRLKH